MIDDNGFYRFEDISFVNTSLFTEAARYYLKYNTYCKAPEGSREWEEFWDLEEDRRKYGMTAPGKLIVNERGETSIQEVRITGEHYNYLNYGRIKRLAAEDLKHTVKLTNNQIKSGRKVVGFPDFWDWDYHYYKAKEYAKLIARHLAVAKSRRKGYSFKEGVGSANLINLYPDTIAIIGAYDYEFITGEGQMMDMAKRALSWYERRTAWTRGYLNYSNKKVKLGYRYEGEEEENGFKSSLIALSFMDKAKAAIGKDAVEIKIEEAAAMKNLIEMIGLTEPTLRDGDVLTGQMIVFGATTNDSAEWEPFSKLYYNPHAHKFLAFDLGDFEDGKQGQPSGFFHSYAKNLVTVDGSAIDKYGNSNDKKANELIDIEDEEAKRDKDPLTYLIWKSQYCRKPSEAFFNKAGGLLSSKELITHINELETNPDYKHLSRNGYLVETNKGVKFEFEHPETGVSAIPIPYPIPTNFKFYDGCHVEWYSPYRDSTGNIPDNLYEIVVDPFATKKEKGTITVKNSLCAAYVYERPNNFTNTKGDLITAEYIARPLDPTDASYELYKLSIRWNAKIQFENDRGTIIPDFKELKALDRLEREPELDFKKEISGTTGRGYGMHMNTNRINAAIIYYIAWLHMKRGNGKLNLHYVNSLALLKETRDYFAEGNFDRVSAMLVLMLQSKEMNTREIKQIKANQGNYVLEDYFDTVGIY